MDHIEKNSYQNLESNSEDVASCGLFQNDTCRSFFLSSYVRFFSDAGAIIAYYVAASVGCDLILTCWIAGGVAILGITADWIRSSFYDSWMKFPKPLDTGQMIVFLAMGALGSWRHGLVLWYNPISNFFFAILLLIAELIGYNVIIDGFRENPKIPREVWTTDRFTTERGELMDFCSSVSKALCFVFFMLTLSSCVEPFWVRYYGSEPSQLDIISLEYALPLGLSIGYFVLRPFRPLSQSTVELIHSGSS